MQRLNPKAVWIFFIQILLSWLIIFLIIVFWFAGLLSSFEEPDRIISYLWIFIIAFVVFLVFSWAWAKWTYYFWKYQLTEDAFRKEYGVIWKKYVSIPYERIQNVDIRRGVLARILGLSDLYIQTAGYSAAVYARRMAGVGSEGYLPGLGREVAEQIRDELIRRAKGTKQGL